MALKITIALSGDVDGTAFSFGGDHYSSEANPRFYVSEFTTGTEKLTDVLGALLASITPGRQLP